jgi:predicted enzyme related to lactoylglutathione lyase
MAGSCSVFLNVRDIDRSLKFYEQLGFKVAKTYEDEGATAYADLEMNGAEVSLGHIPKNDDPEFVSWVSTPLGAGVIVYISVRDVDGVYVKAQEAGWTIEHAPEDRSYGRVFLANDPDGYVLAFIEEPTSPTRGRPAAGRSRASRSASRPAAAGKRGRAPARRRGGAPARGRGNAGSRRSRR